MSTLAFSPGSIVTARGREWIVLAAPDAETLRVRPLTGTEDDQTFIHLGLERDPVTEARFPDPTLAEPSSQDGALLLRDALLLSLRRGAGPFRSFGQIAIEPRAYQLVPLLMALKLDPVRLLIADDVGIGKTIEAALIAKEMLARGDVTRFAVLCPPHLVDQWTQELEVHFHLHAVPVTASSAKRLEDALPLGDSIFTAHPYTVVSLDYIKSDRRRSEFLRACPELVIVDEAHTCASTGPGRHQRYALLKGLTDPLPSGERRHLVMLTATPHSGDEAAFYRLLGLLERDFEVLPDATGDVWTALRERLADHFVQRRRIDIVEWQDNTLFPRRVSSELTYLLAGPSEAFLDAVLGYCKGVVAAAEGGQHMRLWATLALMRCVGSSPAAALQALRSRAGIVVPDDVVEADELDRVFDGAADALPEDDVEPAIGSDDPALLALIRQGEALVLAPASDPKLALLVKHLATLIAEGHNPVVFCRFIATAHYLGKHLAGRLGAVEVGVVTGELTADERRLRVEDLGEAEQRLLVATDCLSEGVNLQGSFDAVVHYDLSWNPTRHEQREGRVDRYGQAKPVVRTTLMYGANNPVDGAVLEVILRKAEEIRIELGVPVPVPDEGHSLTEALLKAVALKRPDPTDPGAKKKPQLTFDFMALPAAQALHGRWQDARERVRKNQTVFAQRKLKPAEVIPEWKKSLATIGSSEAVERFTRRALKRLAAPLEALKRGYRAPLATLPDDVRERLEHEGLDGTLTIDFHTPPAPRATLVRRSHPLVAVLAETLLERTLAGDERLAGPAMLGRLGSWTAPNITTRTTVALVRLRHQLTIPRMTQPLLVEEATALAWTSSGLIEGDDALQLLEPDALADAPRFEREATRALAELEQRRSELEAFADRRAQALLSDHRRVKAAADARGRHGVSALHPVDVIGLYVLLPEVV